MVRSPLYLACVGYFHVLTLELFSTYIMTWTQDHPAYAKAIFSGAGFPDTTSEHDVGVILDSTSFYAEQGGQVSNRFWGHIWVGKLGIDFSPLPVYGCDQRGHWWLLISCMLISHMVGPVESTTMKIESHWAPCTDYQNKGFWCFELNPNFVSCILYR